MTRSKLSEVLMVWLCMPSPTMCPPSKSCTLFICFSSIPVAGQRAAMGYRKDSHRTLLDSASFHTSFRVFFLIFSSIVFSRKAHDCHRPPQTQTQWLLICDMSPSVVIVVRLWIFAVYIHAHGVYSHGASPRDVRVECSSPLPVRLVSLTPRTTPAVRLFGN